MRRTLTAIGALVLLAGCAGSSGSSAPAATGLPTGSEASPLDPARFVVGVTHPYWPMSHGSHWVYLETDAEGGRRTVDVLVTDRAKTVQGVPATVVHDVMTEDGEVVEDTWDWYAQDVDGNLWYLGEDTKEYESGRLTSTAGTWEAGVHGAQAGIALPGLARPGLRYRQEYDRGNAEDLGEVLGLQATARVPFGTFTGLLQTRDTSRLEPTVVERKYYARGVGPVLSETIAGGSDHEALISYTRGR